MRPLPETTHQDLGKTATAAAGALVAVQLASRAFVDELRVAGAPDRGLDGTLADLAWIVRDGAEVALLDKAEQGALRAAEDWLGGQVRELFASGLPVTVGHGDLHLGNVAGGEGCEARLFDWTDACLTHPLLDAVHLATSAGPEHLDAVRDLVLGAWGAAVPDTDLGSAWERAKVVNRLFQAVSYDVIARTTEPASAWELGGVQADILRDLIERHRRATS